MKTYNQVIILGTGPMAQDYAKILKNLSIQFIAVGNSEATAKKFKDFTGVEAFTGGYEKWLSLQKAIDAPAIVALTEDYLGKATLALIRKGAKRILVEKPGAGVYDELLQVEQEALKNDCQVFVGYNRRFYASVLECQKRITEDGGVDSFFFEFTEWGHVVEKKLCSQLLKDQWFWHNSTHVVDLAFHLGGFPNQIYSLKGGTLDWHRSASKYCGCGKTESGALFNYMSNWAAPGRWAVEILTKKHRYVFKPVEKLQVQKIGSVAVEEIQIENNDDVQFKPGLKKQVEAFLQIETKYQSNMVSLQTQAQNMNWFRKIEFGSV